MGAEVAEDLMGLDVQIEGMPEAGCVSYGPDEHRILFDLRRHILAEFPLLSRLLNFFGDGTWTVDELPSVRREVEGYPHAAGLLAQGEDRISALIPIIDKAIRARKPVVFFAD